MFLRFATWRSTWSRSSRRFRRFASLARRTMDCSAYSTRCVQYRGSIVHWLSIYHRILGSIQQFINDIESLSMNTRYRRIKSKFALLQPNLLCLSDSSQPTKKSSSPIVPTRAANYSNATVTPLTPWFRRRAWARSKWTRRRIASASTSTTRTRWCSPTRMSVTRDQRSRLIDQRSKIIDVINQ